MTKYTKLENIPSQGTDDMMFVATALEDKMVHCSQKYDRVLGMYLCSTLGGSNRGEMSSLCEFCA